MISRRLWSGAFRVHGGGDMGTPSDWPSGFKSMVLATTVLIVILMYVTLCVGVARVPIYLIK